MARRPEEDQHGRAELPDGEDDERPQRIARIGQPGGTVDADQREDGIDDTLGIEELAPQDGDGNGAAEDRRQIEQRAIEADGADTLVEHHRDGEGEDELGRYGKGHEGEGDLQRLAEAGVAAEHVDVVVEPDPARRVDDVVFGEAQIKRKQDRPDGEQEEADEPRREKRIAGEVLAEKSVHFAPDRVKAPSPGLPRNPTSPPGERW